MLSLFSVLGSSIALLLLALAAVRFPEIPVLVLLPAAIGAGVASVLPRDRGAWIIGLLAGAVLARFPYNFLLGFVVAFIPLGAFFLRRVASLHPIVIATIMVPLGAYLAAAVGSGSWSTPFHHLLDLCAALAIGATLSVLTYAPTQREQFGPRGRAGFRIR